MLSKRTTRVSLTRTTELALGDRTRHPSDQLWRVEWTITATSGKANHLRATSNTEVSARQLVGNLLKQRPSGVSIEDVYSESV